MVSSAQRAPSDQSFRLACGLLLLAGLTLLFRLALGEPRLRHWFVIPVGLCLPIIGWDTANVLAGRGSAFSPRGLFGLLAVQFHCSTSISTIG